MKYAMLCAVLISTMSLSAVQESNIIKNPIIDGGIGIDVQEGSITYSCIVTQDFYDIFTVLIQKSKGMSVEDLMQKAFKKFMAQSYTSYEAFSQAGVFPKIKGQRYFQGLCTQDDQVISGIKLTFILYTASKNEPLNPQEVLVNRLQSEELYELFCDMLKAQNPAQYYVIQQAYKSATKKERF